MTLRSESKLDREELLFSSEMGWFASLAVSVVALFDYIF